MDDFDDLWLSVSCYSENGASLLVGLWWWLNKSKLDEWEALVDTMGIKSADLKDKFSL